MKRFWSRQPDRPSAADWPEPRPEFLASQASRVRAARGHRERGRVQLALAGVFALAVLVALSAFGGVGYAAQQAENAVSAVSSPFSSDSNAVASGPTHKKPPKHDDDDGYDDKCKDLKKKFKELKRAHIREWHALLAQQWRERKNFSGRKGSSAWHALMKKQWRERKALKSEQHAERKELKKAIKKCKKDRRDDDDDDH